MKNNLAYICSPYRGNILEKARNILYARHLTKLAYVILGLEPCAIGEIRESRRMLQGRSEEVPVYDRK